ncbi:methyltransferase [Aquibacillus halophilus]|uniref:Methyltransferase n=1 Tax=Aquibacillus halophilus TaxID=930132 RepID=A0A6A8DH35_9BACI|nr:tRNA1(Val) (adenine(37)-N6)-methyltransferase [Aquibacillus halophilus]MRH45008.1 methyltransferase [Aquibacillus halophilus]
MIDLQGDERLDYLLAEKEMKIIQSPTICAFSLDAVLLANFTYVPIKRGSILDLCTGNAVIPLLLSRRSQAEITGVEIQPRIVDMAKRSIEINDLTNQLTVIQGDLKEMPQLLGNGKFDLVTCNPPYFKTAKTEHQNKNDYLTIARHEIKCSLEDVVKACSILTRPGGKVSMVHRPGRLVEILTLFKKYKIEPKRLQLVYPKKGKEANILLIEGIRDGSPDLKILEPLYTFDEDGKYTKEIKEIIYGKRK